MIHVEHPGLSCRTVERALGVRRTKATQALRPALHKVARCLLFDSAGTMAALAEAVILEEQLLIRERLAAGERDTSPKVSSTASSWPRESPPTSCCSPLRGYP